MEFVSEMQHIFKNIHNGLESEYSAQFKRLAGKEVIPGYYMDAPEWGFMSEVIVKGLNGYKLLYPYGSSRNFGGLDYGRSINPIKIIYGQDMMGELVRSTVRAKFVPTLAINKLLRTYGGQPGLTISKRLQ